MSDEPKAPMVKCPACGIEQRWSTDNPSRPFCSATCKNQDFVAWANDEQRIPGDPDFDEMFSGEGPGE